MAWIRDSKEVKQVQLEVENNLACCTFFAVFMYERSKKFLTAAHPLKALWQINSLTLQ